MFYFDTCIRAFIKGNLGDDLFVHVLCNRYPNTHFWLCGEHRFRRNFASLSNLSYVSTDKGFIKWFFRFLYVVPFCINQVLKRTGKREAFSKYTCFDLISRHSRCNILISGSIFMELGTEEFYVSPYYKKEEKYYGRKPYVMGCNFGPFHSGGYLEFYRKCFQKAVSVSFRDNYSGAMFPGGNIRVAPDILFAYPVERAIAPTLKNYVLISVINLLKDEVGNTDVADEYEKMMENIVSRLLADKKQVVLMGFCREQQDDRVIDRLAADKKDNPLLHIVNYPDISVHEAAGYFIGADYVIASRYHAMILGWLFRKKVFPICYGEKMLHVIEDFMPGSPFLLVEDIGKFDIQRIWDDMACEREAFPEVEKVAQAALGHFAELDKNYSAAECH